MSADPRDTLLIRFEPPGGGEVLTLPAPADLRFDSEIPGGFKSLSCTLTFPAGTAVPEALDRFASVWVLDRRTGSTVWYGRLTDPGLSSPQGARQFALTAEGPQMLLDGWREVYGVVDRAQASWQAVGEFAASQQSFSGDLTPDGDYNLDIGDLADFGDDLSIDFDGGDPFGGDLGDFNGIDFGGSDYPAVSDYPGYLGFLKDPAGGLGDMLPIPLYGPGADGSWWYQFEPGIAQTGASVSGTTVGTMTVGVGGGISRRRRVAYNGLLAPTADWANHPNGKFRLMSSGVVMRLWGWADPGINWTGYYFEVSETAISIWRVDDGTPTQIATTAVTLVTGVDIDVDFYVFAAPSAGFTLRGEVRQSAVTTTLDYAGTGPYIGESGTYWGVSVAGTTGQYIEFDSLYFVVPD